MKTLKSIVSLGIFLSSGAAFAQTALTDQLNDLKMPENTAPSGLKSETLYSVQPRYTDLAHRFEIDLGGAKNFTSNGLLNQTQIELTTRYHISDRWNVAVSGAYGSNSFTDSANKLISDAKIYPDAAVVKWRADALLGYNLFYGKFRLNMDQVFYFDQYVSVGPGLVNTQFQTALAGIADVGFALWFGKNWSARLGAKNEVYNEKTLTQASTAYQLLGHLDIGYLIGGESHYE